MPRSGLLPYTASPSIEKEAEINLSRHSSHSVRRIPTISKAPPSPTSPSPARTPLQRV